MLVFEERGNRSTRRKPLGENLPLYFYIFLRSFLCRDDFGSLFLNVLGKGTLGKERNFIKVFSRSSAGALIGDIVN